MSFASVRLLTSENPPCLCLSESSVCLEFCGTHYVCRGQPVLTTCETEPETFASTKKTGLALQGHNMCQRKASDEEKMDKLQMLLQGCEETSQAWPHPAARMHCFAKASRSITVKSPAWEKITPFILGNILCLVLLEQFLLYRLKRGAQRIITSNHEQSLL